MILQRLGKLSERLDRWHWTEALRLLWQAGESAVWRVRRWLRR